MDEIYIIITKKQLNNRLKTIEIVEKKKRGKEDISQLRYL